MVQSYPLYPSSIIATRPIDLPLHFSPFSIFELSLIAQALLFLDVDDIASFQVQETHHALLHWSYHPFCYAFYFSCSFCVVSCPSTRTHSLYGFLLQRDDWCAFFPIECLLISTANNERHLDRDFGRCDNCVNWERMR